jgi:L-threonylcarbamoyladenylate synthase
MPAKILKPTPENLAVAAEALRRGEVVAIPTETVYGLAGDATNALALARIFDTKERPTFDPLIVHVGFGSGRIAELDRRGLVDAKKMSASARALADLLMERFWPGPLTLVLPKKDSVPDLATSGLPSVGLRMPRHSVAQALIAATGTPLAAPSANRFGRISPTSAQDVLSELGDRIDWILDGGPCEVGVESTIIAVAESGELTLLRPGGLPVEEIERVAGKTVVRITAANAENAPLAPGMLASHYAPRKPLLILPETLTRLKQFPPEILSRGKLAVLAIHSSDEIAQRELQRIGVRPVGLRCLTNSGDLSEAARALFRSLRELDETDADVIVCEPCETQTGLGFAIGDRLRRAAAVRS